MNNLSIGNIKRLMDIGCDRNIICYDSNSNPEIPTTRLISLLKATARLKSSDKSKCLLDTILVDTSFVTSFIINPNSLEGMYINHVYQRIGLGDADGFLLHGLRVVESLLLEPDEEGSLLKNYYIKLLGGSLQSLDSHLVILFNSQKPIDELSTEDVLLGSY